MTQTYAALRTAARLRTAREIKGLSVAELATAAGVTKTTVYRIEAGTHAPQMSTARALAAALGVTADQIVGDR